MPTLQDTMEIINPATTETLESVPLATAEDVAKTVEASAAAFPAWRVNTPAGSHSVSFQVQAASRAERRRDRAHHQHLKTARPCRVTGGAAARHRERRGRLRHSDADAGLQPRRCRQRHRRDHDSPAARRHVRRSRRSTFPAMIPLWFLPYAIACGNTFILKPSERVPLTAETCRLLAADRSAEGRRESGGRRQSPPSTRCCSIPRLARSALSVRHRSPSTSTPKARPTASVCSARAERRTMSSSCPTPTCEMSAKIVSDSAFGCAGQRCLAVSAAVTVGEAPSHSRKRSSMSLRQLKVGMVSTNGVKWVR